jgi:hypothetical protein
VGIINIKLEEVNSIEKLRISMINAVSGNKFNNREVIKLSQQLDKKIIDYYKIKSY